MQMSYKPLRADDSLLVDNKRSAVIAFGGGGYHVSGSGDFFLLLNMYFLQLVMTITFF